MPLEPLLLDLVDDLEETDAIRAGFDRETALRNAPRAKGKNIEPPSLRFQVRDGKPVLSAAYVPRPRGRVEKEYKKEDDIPPGAESVHGSVNRDTFGRITKESYRAVFPPQSGFADFDCALMKDTE